jgi:hypothetical protein
MKNDKPATRSEQSQTGTSQARRNPKKQNQKAETNLHGESSNNSGVLMLGHTYTFTRQPNGTTDIDVVVVREGKNLKGRLLGFVVGIIGRRVLEKAFENSVKAIEAWNSTAKAARAAGAS